MPQRVEFIIYFVGLILLGLAYYALKRAVSALVFVRRHSMASFLDSEGERLASRKDLARSGLWALVITVPLCLFGASASMALAHSGGPLVLLFAPMFPIFLLFGSGGPFGGIPEWLFATLAAIAQFMGVLLVVHLIRTRRRTRDA